MFNVTLSNNARSGPGQSRVPPVPPVPPSPSPPPPPSRTRQTRAEGRGRAVHAHARVCRLNLSASIHSRPFICCGIRCRTGRQDFPSRGGEGGGGSRPSLREGIRRNFVEISSDRKFIGEGGGVRRSIKTRGILPKRRTFSNRRTDRIAREAVEISRS